MPNLTPEQQYPASLKQGGLVTLWITLLLLVADQLTKIWAVKTLVLAVPVPVMPYLNWTLAYNDGAAFSFLANMDGWQRWFFTGLATLVSIVLLVWLSKHPKKLTIEIWGINLILSGAIGNTIDRFQSGQVTDFIDVYIGSWHYATFNVADMAITLGVGLLIYLELWIKPRLEKTQASTFSKF